MSQAGGVRNFVGASGFSFPHWKGQFYPTSQHALAGLPYYAAHLGTVELNSTFYRLPSREQFASWAKVVSPEFRFSVKAPGRITHQRRLASVDDELREFLVRSEALGETLGPSLFQLPPNFKCHADRLSAFLKKLPRQRKFAIEFRHPSWSVPEVGAMLREFGVATVLTEAELADPDAVSSAPSDFVYVRLRKMHHWADDLEAFARVIESVAVKQKFVYFRHEAGAPFWAAQLQSRLELGPPFPTQRGFSWPDPPLEDEDAGGEISLK